MKSISPTRYGSLFLLCACTVALVGLQQQLLGWSLLGLGLLSLQFADKKFRRNMALLFAVIALLGVTPINTGLSGRHMVLLTILMSLAVIVLYVGSNRIFKDKLISYKLRYHRSWSRSEVLYIVAVNLIAYLFLPYYLRSTGSYHDWTVGPGADYITRLGIGMIFTGIWDELFFICSVLGILRKYFSFKVANLAQAVVFTSFLYQLGFHGWGVEVAFVFAMLQGYIFKKTESLVYVVAIHLSFDLLLFLALIHVYYPNSLSIFPIN